MIIKAIETRYKGYRFRSRLEARWAVFFDSLGVKWEYEKEGFQLSTGERYLPDFWLPNDKIWVEVKGERPNKEYMEMLSTFRNDLSCAVLVVVGIPWENPTFLLASDSGSGGDEYNAYVDISAVNKGRLQLVTCTDPRVNGTTVYAGLWIHPLDITYLPGRTIFPSVGRAIDAAKSARFEHGEKPR